MGGGGSAPQLNSGQIAQQQGVANTSAAIAQSLLNNVNQRTPYGNLTYEQTGGSYDSNNTWVPQFTATTTLSPEQQSILDKTTGIQNQALDLGPNLLKNVEGAISSPLDFSKLPGLPADGQAARDQAFNALMSRNRTELDRQRSADATLAANQGIAPGSEAWNRLTQHNDQALTDATNQATINASALAGQDLSQAQAIRNQGINELLTTRNQPIQDISALLGIGGGVNQPNFVNTPQTQVQPADVTSPALAAYQGQLNAYNQNRSSNNALMGGLFGLGGSILGGLAGGPVGAGLFGLAGRGAGSGWTY